jgi:hypothetical protein
MRKTIAVCAAVAALGGSAGAAGPAGAATLNKCRASSTSGGAKVLVRSSAAVVFAKRGNTYGCVYSGSPIRQLLDEGGGIKNGKGDDTVKPIIAGRYVAYASYGSAIGDEFDRVIVWDLKVGRLASRSSSNSVHSLVVKSNGSVAWTQNSVVEPADQARTVFEVHALSVPDHTDDQLLDRGDDIDPRSLALSADRLFVTWTRGGAPKSAGLN